MQELMGPVKREMVMICEEHLNKRLLRNPSKHTQLSYNDKRWNIFDIVPRM